MIFEEYVKLMERQIKTGDVRERVFQDNIIRPFLKSVFPELDIEPVDIKINTKEHEYEQYCGTYSKNNKTIPATPDLCLANEWYWNNRKVEVNYRGVVEIKSPALKCITGIEPEKYKCLDEINRHLNAKKNSKVILTDGVTWAFYNKNEILNPIIQPICLGEIKYKYKKTKNNKDIFERTSAGRLIVEKIEITNENEFKRLIKSLIEFITPIN